MIRVLQFAGSINRFDFIDNIVQFIDRDRFLMGVAVGSDRCDIEEPVFAETTPRWVVAWRPRRDLLRAARRLAGILRTWRADILHTHHYDEAVIGWLATRLYPRTKLVVGRHYSDAIYRSTSGLKRAVLLGAEQAVNRAASRIIVPSSFIAEMLSVRQRVEPSKIDRIPYGFVAEKYAAVPQAARADLRRQLGIEDRFVIGNFSRLHEEKGQRFLVEALALLGPKVPRATLLLVGEGAERPEIERLIRRLGLGDVVCLLGWRRDAMALMAAVDVVVQPTLQEAFSQVMAEALWMGTPLVMTDVSGAGDVIRDGENGLIVPKEDPIALSEAIGRLAADPAFRARLARAGREHVSNHLGIETIVHRYEQAYLQAMAIAGE